MVDGQHKGDLLRRKSSRVRARGLLVRSPPPDSRRVRALDSVQEDPAPSESAARAARKTPLNQSRSLKPTCTGSERPGASQDFEGCYVKSVGELDAVPGTDS
jgi:hypothetical protein